MAAGPGLPATRFQGQRVTERESDLDLLDMQVEALFTHDADGRIVAVNEPAGGPAPRFFFGRTRGGQSLAVPARPS